MASEQQATPKHLITKADRSCTSIQQGRLKNSIQEPETRVTKQVVVPRNNGFGNLLGNVGRARLIWRTCHVGNAFLPDDSRATRCPLPRPPNLSGLYLLRRACARSRRWKSSPGRESELFRRSKDRTGSQGCEALPPYIILFLD